MRFRIAQTTTVEFEVEPEHYPDGSSLADMLAIDIANVEDDPLIIHAIGEGEPVITVRGEVIP